MRTTHIILAALAASLASGCWTSVMDIDGSADGTTTTNFKNSPVDIKVLDTRRRFVNGFLQVNLEIESGISRPYLLEYKFQWYDNAGMELEPARAVWVPIYLNGRETKTIQGLAPTPNAKSFKVKFREADDQ